MNNMFYPGQRVLLARKRNGAPADKICGAVISEFGEFSVNGSLCDVKIVALDPIPARVGGEAVTLRPGQKTHCLLSQLEPFVPEGAAPSTWDNCVWNPSMLKESNE